MPRGSGKTTLAEAAAIWVLLYGYRRFVLVIGSSGDAAQRLYDSILREFETNDELTADFPEACLPVQALEGIAHRCKGQTHFGERTYVGLGKRRLDLATIAGAACSGGVLRTAGLTAASIRGAKFKRPDGEAARPDLVILDDVQTDEIATNEKRVGKTLRLINQTVLGLAGPGVAIAGIAPCTVIALDDVAEQLLDRKKNPQWQGEKTAMVERWPDGPRSEQLWDDYRQIHRDAQSPDECTQRCNEFYAKNRAAMDANAIVSWPERHEPTELSGLQHAYNLKIKIGDEAFAAEYQNAPLQDAARLSELTADQVQRQVSGRERRIVPLASQALTAFIDVQQDALFYAAAAWTPGMGGAVLEYGVFPDQKISTFSLSKIRYKLGKATKSATLEGAIHAGLGEVLDLLMQPWKREDDVAVSLDRVLIDANWGKSTATVYEFCRLSRFRSVLTPSHGKFYGATTTPIAEYKKKPGERIGHHWKHGPAANSRGLRFLLIDTNYWKSFVHDRLALAVTEPAAITLYGRDHRRHRLFAEHVVAETRTRVKAKDRDVDEWKEKPNRPDNHWFDCLVGAAAAASLEGVPIDGETKKGKSAGGRRRLNIQL